MLKPRIDIFVKYHRNELLERYNSLEQWLSNFSGQILGRLFQRQVCNPKRWDLRICFANKFPGEDEAAGLRIRRWESRI